jgi:membrane protease YdiL (CAAX protease family)
MNSLKRFAFNHPLVFSAVAMLLLFVLMGGTVALAIGLLGYEVTDVEPQIFGQLVATAGFLFLLWRFDWLGSAGISRLGSRRLWFITLLILLYSGLSAIYAFFGTFQLKLALTADMFPDLFHTTMAGVMEEILFRGVILYALIARWNRSRSGIISAVLVSAFLFGGLHFVNLAQSDGGMTAVQVLEAALSAILYGALVLKGGSIWPAVALHSLINLLVNAVAVSLPDFTATAGQMLALNLLDIPLVIYAFYLLSKVKLRPVPPSDQEAFEPALAQF